jgi:hypothetical protein
MHDLAVGMPKYKLSNVSTRMRRLLIIMYALLHAINQALTPRLSAYGIRSLRLLIRVLG